MREKGKLAGRAVPELHALSVPAIRRKADGVLLYPCIMQMLTRLIVAPPSELRVLGQERCFNVQTVMAERALLTLGSAGDAACRYLQAVASGALSTFS